MRKLPRSFHPYAVTTILIWSLTYVWTRLALQHFSALSLGCLRYVIASLALVAICLLTRMPLPKPRDIPWFILSGVTGFFLYMIVFNIGTSLVTAATSSVIIASVPVFTALLARLLLRETLRGRQWIAIAVEFSGILVLTLYGAVFTANTGALWLLTASLLLSSYNLLQRKLTRTYSGLQATAYSIFAGTILLCIFLPSATVELWNAPPVQIMYILLLGIPSSTISYIAWSMAFEKAPNTSVVSNYMFFTPFLTGILGFLLIGEAPDPSTWIGGALILCGAFLFNR